MKNNASVVITDLDNTLYDWVDIWYRSFKPMLDSLVEASGIPEETLKQEIQAIFQTHGTSEYAFVIEEIPSLKAKHPGGDLKELYSDAIVAYRRGRKNATRSYPSVIDALKKIRSAGSLVVAYTESKSFYAQTRLKKLGLDEIVDYLYSPPDDVLPNGRRPEEIRTLPPEEYELSKTTVRHTPGNELKPSAKILSKILEDLQIPPTAAVYIGDDLVKDISMAQAVGVLDAWAKYGKAHDRREYELLKEVTHWTPDAVIAQIKASEATIRPSITLEREFAEILDYVRFGSWDDRVRHPRIQAGGRCN